MLGFDQALDSSLSSLSSDQSSGDDDDDAIDRHHSSQVFFKHLRKCFIASDDNGFCESSLLPDLKVFTHLSEKDDHKTHADDQKRSEYLQTVMSKRINARSYEYVKTHISKDNRAYASSDKNFNPKFLSRMNSSTSSTSEIKFEPINDEDPTEEKKFVSDLVFEAKTEPVKFVPVVSPLTILIQENSNEKNPFQEYLKHEAFGQDPNLVKKFRIFLPSSSGRKPHEKDFMLVTIQKNARISDLIGLVCCKYLSEKRSPPLKCENVSGYNLKIVDDTGDIEFELAPLESDQKVGRFGFNDLALVEKSESSEPNSPAAMFRISDSAAFNFPPIKIAVNIHFMDGTPKAILYLDSDNIPMEKVYEEILKIKLANLNIFCPKLAYRLEHADQPGTAVNIDKTYLNDFKSCPNKYTFYFFRENSARKITTDDSASGKSAPETLTNTDLTTKKLNESSEYDVTYLSKWRKVPFKIEISKETFELEEIKPVEITKLRLTSKLSNFYTISSQHVVSCCYLREKEIAGKSQIRIIVVEEEQKAAAAASSTPVYKHLDFECDASVADDIIKTFGQIFLYCNSSYYKAYQQSKKKSVKWSRRLYNSERLKQQGSRHGSLG